MRKSALILGGVLWGSFGVQPRSAATELTPQTAEAFQRYARATEARIQREVADPATFLYIDSLPDKQKRAIFERLQSGRVVIEPMQTRENGKEIEMPDGLVHHWLAIGFIPGATRDEILALAEDYGEQRKIYAPEVQRAEVLSHDGQHYSVYYRLYRKTIVTVAYDTEFSVDYSLPDRFKAYSAAKAVRINEVESPDTPNEQQLPAGKDHRYMWRFNMYTRYLEKDNGVYIQIEFLSLSRSVPAIFAWLVNPYIRSIPRDYLTQYVLTTRKALTPASGQNRIAAK